MLTTPQWITLLAVVAVAAVLLTALVAARASRRRHAVLKDRFGPEYDRAVEQHGNVARAERELAAREKRVRHQKLRPLAEPDRIRFSQDWTKLQARFVDSPSEAVQEADELIKAVMIARGYEADKDFDERVADLSVEHANVVEHYRAASSLAEANREGRANTEELRQAFVHYRELFADLLAQAAPAPEAQLQPARA
jgi:hypothetical protein